MERDLGGQDWLWAVIIDCNCNEVPINPIIQSRTRYSSRSPGHLIILKRIVKNLVMEWIQLSMLQAVINVVTFLFASSMTAGFYRGILFNEVTRFNFWFKLFGVHIYFYLSFILQCCQYFRLCSADIWRDKRCEQSTNSSRFQTRQSIIVSTTQNNEKFKCISRYKI
jgi:hypothetical protein